MKPTSDSHSDRCARAQDGFAAYLYGELEGPAREKVETHLESCADCAARLASYRETLGHLDDWKLPTQARPENPSEIAARIRSRAGSAPNAHGDAHGVPDSHQARALTAHEAHATPIAWPGGTRESRPGRTRARLVQMSARLTAIAAAVLVTFSVLGAEISTSGGQFQLRMAMPWSRNTASHDENSAQGPEVRIPEQQLRRIAADEFSHRATSFERQLQQIHNSWTLETESERKQIALVVDRSREEQRRAIIALEDLITQLQRRQAQLDQRTRDALVELTEAVLVLSE